MQPSHPPSPGYCQVPVMVSNRVGVERVGSVQLTFYGGSFITGARGEVVAQVRARPPAPLSASHGSPPHTDTRKNSCAAWAWVEESGWVSTACGGTLVGVPSTNQPTYLPTYLPTYRLTTQPPAPTK